MSGGPGSANFPEVAAGADSAAAVQIAERLVQVCSEPHEVGAAALARVGVSVGIALAPQHGRTIDELLAHADEAMYTSKRRSKGTWTLHAA